MKKRIFSMLVSLSIFCGVFSVSVANVHALENEPQKVDGSYLTMEDSSRGTSSGRERGEHMMTGECSISKAGRDEIYCYGATTANHEVDRVIVLVYVDRYHEATEDQEAYWGQIDAWAEEANNDYFVHTDKTLEVERGYYYRVHADHFVVEGDDPIEETFSFTDGIYLPE